MTRSSCLILTILLSSACAKEPSEDRAKQPSEAAKDPAEPASTAKQLPEADTSRVSVSASASEAAGLPALAFSLDLGSSGMSGTSLEHNRYMTLSGPPGGPLMLLISPATVGADFSNLVGGDQVLDATLVDQEVELLGAKRRAVAWITGASMARTSWCALIVAPEGAAKGDPALVLELGVGHSGDDTVCATARDHHVLGPVVDSFRFE